MAQQAYFPIPPGSAYTPLLAVSPTVQKLNFHSAPEPAAPLLAVSPTTQKPRCHNASELTAPLLVVTPVAQKPNFLFLPGSVALLLVVAQPHEKTTAHSRPSPVQRQENHAALPGSQKPSKHPRPEP